METPMHTPIKTYFLGNICVLCGFSFIQTEKLEDGTEIKKKFLDRKLKLNSERVQNIAQVTDIRIHTDDECGESGVCQKCYRSVEKVLRSEKEVLEIKKVLKESAKTVSNTLLLNLPSPKRKSISKRMLRSPATLQPPKKQSNPIVPISIIKPVKIAPFSDISNINFSTTVSRPATVHMQAKQSESTGSKTVTVRRSLGRSFAETTSQPVTSILQHGEVEITIYYPSGKRTQLIQNENHKKLCKAIFKSENVEKTVVDILLKSCPEEVVNAATKVVASEARELCKRNSGSILQRKDNNSLMTFTWDKFNSELQLRAPNILKVVTAMASDIPVSLNEKKYTNILHTIASAFHGRSQEMSGLHYCISFVLVHGGCTLQDIQRLAKIGVCVTSSSVQSKLISWRDNLDVEILKLRDDWANGGQVKFQLVGDNWDKNILPSFRTSQQKTLSIHLFNTIAVVDRITPVTAVTESQVTETADIEIKKFIPSVQEQEHLMEELVFLVASAVIQNIPQMKNEFGNVYPIHFTHKYSLLAGEKTKQYPLGLFDCNETKTAEVIQLLKQLQKQYVPFKNEQIVEPVFFGGDRLTDERIQCAQQAMLNGETAAARLEGFISKIEDFHRLMNFLEAIGRLTYSTESGSDRGTVYYFRNILNARNVKGEVRNAYRPYRILYYTILDAMCCLLFLKEFGIDNFDQTIPLPDNFGNLTSEEKVNWINTICRDVLKQHFFDSDNDIMKELREILTDPNHPENYWLANLNNGKVKCHFCDKSYTYIGSLKVHEEKKHNTTTPPTRKTITKGKDEIESYCHMLFKLSLLHKNLDTAVDMGDGERSVRSSKYELPIYNLTSKTKYAIGSIHLISLTEGILPCDQKERLIANRFINLQGGKNNNMALDEYVELLNRDSKIACSGFQTKESILSHSRMFPHIINFVKHYDSFCNVSVRKGFHHLPSYTEDVKKVATELSNIDAFSHVPGRKLKCKALSADRKIFDNCFYGLATMINRHKPVVAFHRLRNKRL